MTENELIAISYDIGEAFYFKYISFKKGYTNKDAFIKKNFKYFKEAAYKFSVREGFNSRKFVEAFFYGEGIKYPPQITIENNWKKYTEYISNNRQTLDEERLIAQKLISSVYVLKRYKNVVDFLENGKYYVNQIINGYQDFDLLIFWFSKSFCKFYESNKEKFTKQYNPNLLRVNPKKYPRIINKIKEILGEDYIE